MLKINSMFGGGRAQIWEMQGTYSVYMCLCVCLKYSALLLFLIPGGGGKVQLVCWVAQMWVDPQAGSAHSLMVPDWARRLLEDRGQAWPSFALTPPGCPLTLWVGGPPCLSLTQPVTFLVSLLCSLSLQVFFKLPFRNWSWFSLYLISHMLFFHFVPCSLFPFLLLSWHACRGTNPPFLLLLLWQ